MRPCSRAQNPSILKDKLKEAAEETNPTCHSTEEGWMGKTHALSTLMCGTVFCSFKQSIMSLALVVDWHKVSLKMMVLDTYSLRPGLVHGSCLNAWQLCFEG
jgi:hypothetical protein